MYIYMYICVHVCVCVYMSVCLFTVLPVFKSLDFQTIYQKANDRCKMTTHHSVTYFFSPFTVNKVSRSLFI